MPATAAAAVPGGPTAGAARVGATPAAAELQLVFPLKADLSGLRRLALAVSTPGSPQYRHYQSFSGLARRFGASRATAQRTLEFLRHAGATGLRLDATGLFVDATLRAATAERLFGTSLAQFRVRQTTFTAPAVSPSLPRALRGLVTGVVGLNTQPVATAPSSFRTARAVRAALARAGSRGASSAFTPLAHAAAAQPSSFYSPASGTPSGCPQAVSTGAFTPNQYLTAYGFAPLQAAGLTGQGERVALIEIDGFRHSDITTFAGCFGLRVPAIDSFGVGIKKPLGPGGEATLDLEVLTAAAPGLKAIDVYESTADEASALKALTSPLQNPGFKPQVISASLGLCEPFVYDAVGRGGVSNTEGALEMAAASGISFLDSSGDAGSADCTANGLPIPRLAVNYPTSSWWVTGVGGTNVQLNADNTLSTQVVWNDTVQQPGSAGGGGTSVLWKRPPYQTGTVVPNHREVPDVSMLSDIAPGYAIYCTANGPCINSSNANPWQGVGGTSAATPLLAGGFAMIDEYLRTHGRQDLGLANPLLYNLGRSPEAATVFNDVTQYGNDVGPYITNNGAPLGCCTAGPGYDEASGWGSVILPAFAAAALVSQPAIVDIALSLPGHQRPIAARFIKTQVSCSGRCLVGSFAYIQIGRQRPFQVYSRLYTLGHAGRKTVLIKFTSGQLAKLRSGLVRHSRITAAVFGAIVDAGGNIERKSAVEKFRITA